MVKPPPNKLVFSHFTGGRRALAFLAGLRTAACFLNLQYFAYVDIATAFFWPFAFDKT